MGVGISNDHTAIGISQARTVRESVQAIDKLDVG